MRRRKHLEVAQQPFVDQFLRRRGPDQLRKQVAEPLAPGCRRQPDHRGIQPDRTHPLSITFEKLVDLVDHYDIRRWHLPPLQRLHTRYLHRLETIRLPVIGLHHANILDALARKHLHRLVDKRDRRHRKQHLFALRQSTVHKLSRQHRLSKAGRSLHHYMLQIVAHCLSQAVQCLMLIRSQRSHYDSSSDSWGVSWALAIRANSSGTIFTNQSRLLSITQLTASSVSITSSFSDCPTWISSSAQSFASRLADLRACNRNLRCFSSVMRVVSSRCVVMVVLLSFHY